MLDDLHRSVRLLYRGRSKRAQQFRYGLIAFDAITIIYFILTAAVTQTPLLHAINVILGLLILIDLLARLWVSPNAAKELRRIYTIADILVIATLLLAPLFTEELAFLRILRGLRLIHS